MVYDIESEFDGDKCCNFDSPMLCVTLKCSCGEYSKVISRCHVDIDGAKCIVVNNNVGMARKVITCTMV